MPSRPNRVARTLIAGLGLFLSTAAIASDIPLEGTGSNDSGKVKLGGVALDPTVDMQFRIFDAAEGGASIAAAKIKRRVALASGQHPTALNFGGTLCVNSDLAEWPQVEFAGPAGSGVFVPPRPRIGGAISCPSWKFLPLA